MLNGFILIIASAILLGCDSGNQESYKIKIDRFEKNYAVSQIDTGIEQAINLSSDKSIENVEIPTHNSLPIPIIYKKNYEELGFDTSKMQFSIPEWYTNQQQHKALTTNDIQELSPDEAPHDH